MGGDMSGNVGRNEEISIPEEELVVVESGTPVDAKIVGIVKAKCRDVVPIDRIRDARVRERWSGYANRDCVVIEVEVGGIVYRLFPMVVSSNPRSTFYRLVAKYGRSEGGVRKLRVGDAIKVVFTPRGFPRPYLE